MGQIGISAQCQMRVDWKPFSDALDLQLTMPCVEIGVIGGGTSLPTQSAALRIIAKENLTREIIGSTLATVVLGSELSLLAAHAEGTLASSHSKLGRS